MSAENQAEEFVTDLADSLRMEETGNAEIKMTLNAAHIQAQKNDGDPEWQPFLTRNENGESAIVKQMDSETEDPEGIQEKIDAFIEVAQSTLELVSPKTRKVIETQLLEIEELRKNI